MNNIGYIVLDPYFIANQQSGGDAANIMPATFISQKIFLQPFLAVDQFNLTKSTTSMRIQKHDSHAEHH